MVALHSTLCFGILRGRSRYGRSRGDIPPFRSSCQCLFPCGDVDCIAIWVRSFLEGEIRVEGWKAVPKRKLN